MVMRLGLKIAGGALDCLWTKYEPSYALLSRNWIICFFIRVLLRMVDCYFH